MMRSTFSGLRACLLSWGICVCGVLALSTTLSANSTVLTLGAISSYYGGAYVPPYPGAIEVNNDPNDQMVVSLICLDGNKTNYFTEAYSGTVETLSTDLVGENATLVQDTEEAAFLASLVMYDAAHDKISISVSGVGGGGYVTQTQHGSMTVGDFVNSVEGPIAFAIWQVMGTLEGPPDPASAPYVTLAQNVYNTYMKNGGPAVQAFNSSVQIFIPDSNNPNTQRFFLAYGNDASFVPEPGTMVLFGTGVVLMGLGCARRLRRPR
jgi:hypothetical protein